MHAFCGIQYLIAEGIICNQEQQLMLFSCLIKGLGGKERKLRPKTVRMTKAASFE